MTRYHSPSAVTALIVAAADLAGQMSAAEHRDLSEILGELESLEDDVCKLAFYRAARVLVVEPATHPTTGSA